ncbi:glycoside hydrolase [Coprinopsis marcescibilis]|uniref:Glycoside hydrolase n=1 Tax=Coprinopsis marcescibilis TaxID=230819 RepID=A0A5C3L9D0_COPMA|nr:glycoside hydrolase [Coprinopsis marcescibilis]
MLISHRLTAFLVTSVFVELVASQQIWDVWQTTRNRTNLFKSNKRSSALTFVDAAASTSANFIVQDLKINQPVVGFGGSLTDSSAQLFHELKVKNAESYWNLLNYLFSPVEDANAAGLSYIRVPLGASDFSARRYTYDDVDGDTCLNDFDMNYTPSYVYSVLNDIQSVNSMMKVHLVPWSPPGWMKSSGTMNGGSLKSEHVELYAWYLFKALQGFKAKGIFPYAVSVQNEVLNNDSTKPTARFSVSTEGEVGRFLKGLMRNNGLHATKLIGYNHNWDNADKHPVQLMQTAGDAFDGVAFHCYAGSASQQDSFRKSFPNKEIYFTECSGIQGSDWWSDIKKFMDQIILGSINHNAQVALMWNLALDGNGNPRLSGSNTACGNAGCRGVVTINSDGSWVANQEFYALAQISKGTIPRDINGPGARRLGVSIDGSLKEKFSVGAYVTYRTKSTDQLRYSLVVLNMNDGNNDPVTATIQFRDKRVSFSFPVGVTTLWWYAKSVTKRP